MNIGVLRESGSNETRIALTPGIIKKMQKFSLSIIVESGAGLLAGYPDSEYQALGAKIASRQEAAKADVIFAVNRLNSDDISLLKSDALILSLMETFKNDDYLEKMAKSRVNAIALELIPRISRAQSMDVLSSQANIAGYRAVIEAAARFGRFFPMMMTSAGLAKAAKVCILGVGVAGLQAIATARRLGAQVEAFDVRPEVKEQVQSLGAKFLDLGLSEEGTGQGGYAKELSEEGKKKQQLALAEKLKAFDIVITTANIPGRKAPVLITEESIKGMRAGSVIIDMAVANGGNCPLSEMDKVIEKHGVNIVGIPNYPALMPTDASQFWAGNLWSLLQLLLVKNENTYELKYNLEDEIINAALVTYQGQVRFKKG